MKSVDDGLAQFLGWIAIAVGGVIYGGWILSLFWNWFALPVFPNLPVLGIGAAIGIRLLIGALLPIPEINDNGYKRSTGMTVFITFGVQTFGLFMGWLVHLFI